MTYALLFAGQGTQHAQMLPWLDGLTGHSLALNEMAQWVPGDWRKALLEPAMRGNNRLAQPLLTGTSLAVWQLLAPHMPSEPAVVAGYSVGELAACACAGALTVADALRLACQRAEMMDRAAGLQPGGLLSVSGVAVDEVLKRFAGLSCAIRIDHDHALFGGLVDALDAAEASLASTGASCKRLAINVASHTPLMAEAASAFAGALSDVEIRRPGVPLVINADASLTRRPDVLRSALSAQICRTVDWAACMDTLDEQGVQCVLEIGSGAALSGMWNRRFPAIPARAVEDFQTPQGAAGWVAHLLSY
jgi:[acyl-carrier-protein] S-malonyltransferase